MNYKKIFKKNRGATVTDVTIAISLLVLFTGILTTSIIKIYKNNLSIKIDAYVIDCCVKICEYIDEIPYNEVNSALTDETIREEIETKYEDYEILDNYKIAIDVENFNTDNMAKQDIIKKVKVSIEYQNIGETKTYTVNKLKIKEI